MQLVVQVLPGLHIPDQALKQGPATVRQHGHWQSLATLRVLQAQPVTSTCTTNTSFKAALHTVQKRQVGPVTRHNAVILDQNPGIRAGSTTASWSTSHVLCQCCLFLLPTATQADMIYAL